MNGSNLRTPSSLPSAGRMRKQKYRFVGNGRRRVFQFERLEQRQLLAADVFIQPAIHKVVDGDDTPAPFTRSVDSAAIVAPWQTVEFDPVTRTERVLAATEEDSKFLQSLEGFAQSQGFSGIMDLIGGPQKPPVEKTTGDKDSEEKDVDLGVERNWIIWGADGRTRVADTTAYPYSAVGKQWQTYGSSMFVCSGALVGPFHFLTAGHCVHNGTAYADSIVVSMGQDGLPLGATRSDDQFFGEARWTLARTFTGWTSSGDWNWDLAVVTLDRNIGSHTGWLGYGYNDDNNFFNNSNARTSGYPGDLNNATVGLGQYTQTGNIRSQGITTHQLRTNTMDTWGGQSGSSVWYDGPHSYGVYSHSAWADQARTIPLYNSWTRITESKFESINSWRATDTSPTDRPDLVDYDEWFNTSFAGFSPSSVPVGQPINVTAFPRNNATAAAGPFSVRFRLSTNQVYDTSDHLLGDVSISSLDPFNWATANLVANVPNIPTGQYYIVWSIDPFSAVTEFVENNNTGSTDLRVTITPPLLPDLRGWWSEVQSSTLTWGETFQVRGQVSNIGLGSVQGSFYQDFILSSNNIWGDEDDILLGWQHLQNVTIPANSLGPEFFVTLTLPSSPPSQYLGSSGPFYIGMKSDGLNQIAESNESNNGPMAFTRTVDWDSFYIELPDLAGWWADVIPENLIWGETFQVYGQVRNLSRAPVTNPFAQDFYLSTNNVWGDADDIFLGRHEHTAAITGNGLGPDFYVTLTLPSSPPSQYLGAAGPFFIGMKTDALSQVAEADETNNGPYAFTRTVDWDSFYIELPDLAGWWADVIPENLIWGETFQVYGQVRNLSRAPVTNPFAQDFYLSTNNVWGDADDIFLGRHEHTAAITGNGLGPDFYVTLTLPSSPPLGYSRTGTFFVGMKSDALSQIAETDETNNGPGAFTRTVDWDVFAVQAASIADAKIVHNGWTGGNEAESNIDSVKSLAREGAEPQTLSFDNLINSIHGVNGIYFDISDLGNPSGLSLHDFDFRVSPAGVFTLPPSSWVTATVPTMNMTTGPVSRVSFSWPNGTIMNRWIQITIKANATTGLVSPEVFYVGHLLGETTGPSGSVFTVSFADITPIRSAVGSSANAGSSVDIDKNGTVAFADISAMRGNVGAQLTVLTIPAAGAASELAGTLANGGGEVGRDIEFVGQQFDLKIGKISAETLIASATPLIALNVDAINASNASSSDKPVVPGHNSGEMLIETLGTFANNRSSRIFRQLVTKPEQQIHGIPRPPSYTDRDEAFAEFEKWETIGQNHEKSATLHGEVISSDFESLLDQLVS